MTNCATDIVRSYLDFEDSSCDEELFKICAIVEEKIQCHSENYSCDKELEIIFESVDESGRNVNFKKLNDIASCDVSETVETITNGKNRATHRRKSLAPTKKRKCSPAPSTSHAADGTKVITRAPAASNQTSSHVASKKSRKRRIWTSEIDDLFVGISKPSRRPRKQSSTLERVKKDGKKVYISTKVDNGTNATHLIKLEIYDLKKLSRVPSSQRWRYATVKAKYYSTGPKNRNLQMAKNMILSMAEEISK